MKEALNAPTSVGAHMLDGVRERAAGYSGRQHVIGGRTVLEERLINEGGFAYIWTARDVQTNEELALKKIVCQDREALAMARREIEILERLPEHPNLVRYYGHTICSMEGGRAREVILLFELCAGGHLLDHLDRNGGKLTEEQILDAFRDICTGVNLLHSWSPPVQHRDLKVENVLLGSIGTRKCFKICDFGSWCNERKDPSSLDQQARAQLMEQIERYTTMMYRPPEMVDFYQQFKITEKVDIWMLGCILYTLMFCRHPFQDESTLAISNARYYLPSAPVYSDKLYDLTHWLLARDPVERPSAQRLLAIVSNFKECGDLPVPASVVEKREQHRRLYSERRIDDKPPRSASHGKTSEKSLSRKGKEKQRDRSARARKERDAKSDFVVCPAAWGISSQNETPAQNGVAFWPPAPVPEPSRAWATFDESVGSDAGQCTQPRQHENIEEGSGKAWAAAWDTGVTQPSASSTAPHTPQNAPEIFVSADDLTHSGHSNLSGFSAHSRRSGRSNTRNSHLRPEQQVGFLQERGRSRGSAELDGTCFSDPGHDGSGTWPSAGMDLDWTSSGKPLSQKGESWKDLAPWSGPVTPVASASGTPPRPSRRLEAAATEPGLWPPLQNEQSVPSSQSEGGQRVPLTEAHGDSGQATPVDTTAWFAAGVAPSASSKSPARRRPTAAWDPWTPGSGQFPATSTGPPVVSVREESSPSGLIGPNTKIDPFDETSTGTFNGRSPWAGSVSHSPDTNVASKTAHKPSRHVRTMSHGTGSDGLMSPKSWVSPTPRNVGDLFRWPLGDDKGSRPLLDQREAGVHAQLS